MSDHPTPGERGVALVLVLWALVFLSVLASNFASGMRVQATMTRNTIDQMQAYYAARAGLEIGVARVLHRMQFVRRHGTRNPDREIDVRETRSDEESTDETESTELWKIDGRVNETEIEGAAIRVFITHESGKIDLNKSNVALARKLFEQWDIDKSDIDVMVDSIADWRDGDNLHRQNGAEDDYYESLEPAYTAKNDDFSSVEELLRVRGFNQETLFTANPKATDSDSGNDEEKASTDEDAEQKKNELSEKSDQDDQSDEPKMRLVDCFTVHNKSGRINLSYAPKPVIRSIPFITEGLADRIINKRKEVGGEKLTLGHVREALGEDIYRSVQNYIKVGQTTNESYYSIFSEATMTNGFVAKIKAVANINERGDAPVQYVQWIDWVN